MTNWNYNKKNYRILFKSGQSLAITIPIDIVKKMKLKNGDIVDFRTLKKKYDN